MLISMDKILVGATAHPKSNRTANTDESVLRDSASRVCASLGTSLDELFGPRDRLVLRASQIRGLVVWMLFDLGCDAKTVARIVYPSGEYRRWSLGQWHARRNRVYLLKKRGEKLLISIASGGAGQFGVECWRALAQAKHGDGLQI